MLIEGDGAAQTLSVCIVLYCIVLYCIVLYCIVLYCIVLYCIVLYCIELNCIVLYCIVLYCIVLYCIVLYCIVLYCIVLYCIVLYCIDLYCTVGYFGRPLYDKDNSALPSQFVMMSNSDARMRISKCKPVSQCRRIGHSVHQTLTGI